MLKKLEFVLALARERNFGRAAEACGVSQPTLSNGLRALEDQLGILIVQRSSKFRGFTPEGERVLEWARRIVGDAKTMRLELDGMKRGLVGHLKIAAIPTALPFIATLTTPFRERFPAVRFTVLSQTSAEILQHLDDLEIDAGVSYLDNEPVGQFRTQFLYDERYSLLTAQDGPFAGRTAVTWAEVAGLPLCLLTPDMQNRRIIDRMFRDAGVSIEPTLASNSTIVLISHVRSGIWSSIMPRVLADGMGLPASIASIPITEPDVSHSVGLIVPHREPGQPVVEAFVRFASRAGRGLA